MEYNWNRRHAAFPIRDFMWPLERGNFLMQFDLNFDRIVQSTAFNSTNDFEFSSKHDYDTHGIYTIGNTLDRVSKIVCEGMVD